MDMRLLVRRAWPLLLLATAVLGCGQELPPAADANMARQALGTALEAWKSGQPGDSLKKASPPVYFTDKDWQAGKRLTAFEVKENSEHFGLQVRCFVALSLDDNGQAVQKDVKYLIDTQPTIVIVRDDF
ncbi:MAG: hypothetical protein HYS13_10590 [Planctomycetia bacterium]|nr:hypothetical protein [Planctomycetia bacterium]